jgi:hypothetical protein
MRDCSSDDCRPYSPRDIERDSQRLYRWIRSIEAQKANIMVDQIYSTSDDAGDYLNIRVKNFDKQCCDLKLYFCDANLVTLSVIDYNDVNDEDHVYYKAIIPDGSVYFALTYDILNILGTVIDPTDCEFIYPVFDSGSGPSPSGGKDLSLLTLNTTISKIVFSDVVPVFNAAELDCYLSPDGLRTGLRIRFITDPITIGLGNFSNGTQTSYNVIYENGAWVNSLYSDTYYDWNNVTRTLTPKIYFNVNKVTGLPLVSGLGKYY